MMRPKVASAPSEGGDLVVVIVNYRTGRLVVDCLASLAPEMASNAGARVLIIDNASQDGSDLVIDQAIARCGWGAWARLIRSPVNGGFAYGNNLAIRTIFAACGDARLFDRALIWMLNPDTVVRPGAVDRILSFMRAHPYAGAIGTAIEDDTGALWPYAFRFHSLAGEIESAFRSSMLTRLLRRYALAREMGARPERVDWVSGASVVLRGAVVRTAGWFDEGYFLYFEETDFFHRVARAGWDRWYVPAARIQHISGQSTGLTARDAALRRVPTYWFRSRRRYLIKNHGRLYAIAADLITLSGILVWRTRCAILRRPHGGAPYFVRDFLRHSAAGGWGIGANPALAAYASPVAQAPEPISAPLARSA
jgi:N-acetylglucosaminyl-diphospho-decaprenol L-rhamnosyltransferase